MFGWLGALLRLLIRWFGLLALGVLVGVLLLAAIFIFVLAKMDFSKKKSEKKFPNIGVKQIGTKVVRTLAPEDKAMKSLDASAKAKASLGGGFGGGQRLLRVRVLGARELLPADKARSSADPLVRVQLGSQVAHSPFARHTLNPAWDWEALLRVDTAALDQSELLLDVCQRASPPRSLGTARVRLAALLLTSGGPERALQLPLTGLAQTPHGIVRARGSLSLAISLLSSPAAALGPADDPAAAAAATTAAAAAAASGPAGTSPAEAERAAERRRALLLSQTGYEKAAAAGASGAGASGAAGGADVHACFLHVKGPEGGWVERYCTLQAAPAALRISTDETEAVPIARLDLRSVNARRCRKRLTFELTRGDKRPFGSLLAASLTATAAPARPPKTLPDPTLAKLRLRTDTPEELEQWLTLLATAVAAAEKEAPLEPLDKDKRAKEKEKERLKDSASGDALAKQLQDEERRLLGGTEALPNGAAAAAAAGVGVGALVGALEARGARAVASPWASLLVGRVFAELTSSAIFANEIGRQIKTALRALPPQEFLGAVELQALQLGRQGPSVAAVRAGWLAAPNEMLAELELEYPGGLALALSTEVYLNWPRPRAAVVPVQLHVAVNFLAGRLCLYGPASLSDRYRVFFSSPPAFQPNVRVELGDKQRQVLTSTVRKFIYNALNKALSSVLVAPAFVEFFLPYPGKLASAKVHSVTSVKEEHAPAPAPPLAPAAAAAAPAAKRPVLKPETHARRYLVARLFDEVLNRGELAAIDGLYMERALVHHATSRLDEELVGRAAVRAFVQRLHRSFPDLVMNVEDLAHEGDFVYARWTARGTYSYPLWPSAADDKPIAEPREVLLAGCSLSLFKHGNQRIAEQWHFWSLPTLTQLLPQLAAA